MNTAAETSSDHAQRILDEAQIAQKEERNARLHARINKAAGFLNVFGLGWLLPLLKIAAGDDAQTQLKDLWRLAGIPVLAILIFLVAWGRLAPTVETSLGAIPGPAQVWEQTGVLWEDHKAERVKEAAFYERQEKRNAKKLERNPDATVKIRPYTGKPTYIDQIVTSLKTVFMGFIVASLIAIPLGIACGLSTGINAALSPLIQIFKPVSPLAWLPIVTMIVSALYVSDDPFLQN